MFVRNRFLPVSGSCIFLAFHLLCAAISASEIGGSPARVKDVATIEGIRDNQLVGYGLVVGLRGTGDSSQTVFPAQTLLSVLQKMGITVPETGSRGANNMQVKNMAGVFVVATLPPFSRPGNKLDVTVSSAGDARSLEGGVLLMTPLYWPRWPGIRRSAGSTGAGRLHGCGWRQQPASEPSHNSSHTRWRARRASGHARPAFVADCDGCFERCRLPYRRANGFGY
jgi:hypothetical protein